MRELMYFDIETVGEYSDFTSFEKNDKRGAELFSDKFLRTQLNNKYDSINEAYIKESSVLSTFGKIVCISFGFTDNNGEIRIKSFYGDDERDIVDSFNETLKKIEQKNFNLSGFRILHFDIIWLLRKLAKYNITPANIIYMYNKKPWEARIVDISDDWKLKSNTFTSFDEMCYELEIDSPKLIMNGSMIHEYYHNGNIEDIKNYCESDIKALIECGNKLYKYA